MSQKSKNSVRCWASGLGKCSNEESAEHYVSQGLFKNKLVKIEGQKWLNGEVREVSKTKLGLKILCREHNRQLGVLDSEAIRFSKILTENSRLVSERSSLPRSALWRKNSAVFDGKTLERWMIKASIGLIFEAASAHWHDTGTQVDKPPLSLVQYVFGENGDIQASIGLYSLPLEGERMISGDSFTLLQLLHPDSNGYVGCEMYFNCFHCLVWLSETEWMEMGLPSMNQTTYGHGYSDSKRRPERFDFICKGKVSGVIDLIW